MRHIISVLVATMLAGCCSSAGEDPVPDATPAVDSGLPTEDTGPADAGHCYQVQFQIDPTLADGTHLMPTAHFGDIDSLVGQFQMRTVCDDGSVDNIIVRDAFGRVRSGLGVWAYLDRVRLVGPDGRDIGSPTNTTFVDSDSELHFTPRDALHLRQGEWFTVQIRADVPLVPRAGVRPLGILLERPFDITVLSRSVQDDVPSVGLFGANTQSVYLATFEAECRTEPDGFYSFCWSSDTALEGCCSPDGFSERRCEPAPGSLIKATLPSVYVIGRDGRRYVFPSSTELTSWYGHVEWGVPTSGGLGGHVCNAVSQILDADLAAIPIRGNVTVRPGSFVLRLDRSPGQYYLVARGGILRRVHPTIARQIYRGVAFASIVRDLDPTLEGSYTFGTEVHDPSEFDPRVESATTLLDELEAVHR